MAFTFTHIQKLGQLARVAVRDAESERLMQRLEALEAGGQDMRAVPTEGVLPLVHPLPPQVAPELRLREDVVSEPDQRELYQQNAPAVEDGLFLVPKVIE